MDLNVDGGYKKNEWRLLAPSWSHGSKFSDPVRAGKRHTGWLPRGAMDLNFLTLHLCVYRKSVGSLVEPWI